MRVTVQTLQMEKVKCVKHKVMNSSLMLIYLIDFLNKLKGLSAIILLKL